MERETIKNDALLLLLVAPTLLPDALLFRQDCANVPLRYAHVTIETDFNKPLTNSE